MADCKMKVMVDLSDMERIGVVHCNALMCEFNTINRSHGTSAGHCCLKHVQITREGRCTSYAPRTKGTPLSDALTEAGEL